MYMRDETIMITIPQVEEACDYVQLSWNIHFNSLPTNSSDISSIRNGTFRIFSGGNISTSQQNGDFSVNYTDLRCGMVG